MKNQSKTQVNEHRLAPNKYYVNPVFSSPPTAPIEPIKSQSDTLLVIYPATSESDDFTEALFSSSDDSLDTREKKRALRIRRQALHWETRKRRKQGEGVKSMDTSYEENHQANNENVEAMEDKETKLSTENQEGLEEGEVIDSSPLRHQEPVSTKSILKTPTSRPTPSLQALQQQFKRLSSRSQHYHQLYLNSQQKLSLLQKRIDQLQREREQQRQSEKMALSLTEKLRQQAMLSMQKKRKERPLYLEDSVSDYKISGGGNENRAESSLSDERNQESSSSGDDSEQSSDDSSTSSESSSESSEDSSQESSQESSEESTSSDDTSQDSNSMKQQDSNEIQNSNDMEIEIPDEDPLNENGISSPIPVNEKAQLFSQIHAIQKSLLSQRLSLLERQSFQHQQKTRQHQQSLLLKCRTKWHQQKAVCMQVAEEIKKENEKREKTRNKLEQWQKERVMELWLIEGIYVDPDWLLVEESLKSDVLDEELLSNSIEEFYQLVASPVLFPFHPLCKHFNGTCPDSQCSFQHKTTIVDSLMLTMLLFFMDGVIRQIPSLQKELDNILEQVLMSDNQKNVLKELITSLMKWRKVDDHSDWFLNLFQEWQRQTKSSSMTAASVSIKDRIWSKLNVNDNETTLTDKLLTHSYFVPRKQRYFQGHSLSSSKSILDKILECVHPDKSVIGFMQSLLSELDQEGNVSSLLIDLILLQVRKWIHSGDVNLALNWFWLLLTDGMVNETFLWNDLVQGTRDLEFKKESFSVESLTPSIGRHFKFFSSHKMVYLWQCFLSLLSNGSFPRCLFYDKNYYFLSREKLFVMKNVADEKKNQVVTLLEKLIGIWPERDSAWTALIVQYVSLCHSEKERFVSFLKSISFTSPVYAVYEFVLARHLPFLQISALKSPFSLLLKTFLLPFQKQKLSFMKQSLLLFYVKDENLNSLSAHELFHWTASQHLNLPAMRAKIFQGSVHEQALLRQPLFWYFYLLSMKWNEEQDFQNTFTVESEMQRYLPLHDQKHLARLTHLDTLHLATDAFKYGLSDHEKDLVPCLDTDSLLDQFSNHDWSRKEQHYAWLLECAERGYFKDERLWDLLEIWCTEMDREMIVSCKTFYAL